MKRPGGRSPNTLRSSTTESDSRSDWLSLTCHDAFLLAMAMAGEADYLVTGDHRAGLLQHGSIGRTRIVTPTIFCAEVL